MSGGTSKDDEDGEDTILKSVTEIQLWDKHAAVDKIMKHLGMYQERGYVPDNDPVPPAHKIDAAEKAAKELLEGTVH